MASITANMFMYMRARNVINIIITVHICVWHVNLQITNLDYKNNRKVRNILLFRFHNVIIVKSVSKQAWNTFSLKSVSQVFQYTNFSINRVLNFPKVEVTQNVQCPSFPNCQSPSHSKSKSPKAQVTQSSSYPKSKLPKLPKAQVNNLSNVQVT